MSAAYSESTRPKDTAFRQQRINAWHPILQTSYVIGGFLIIGVVCIPVGYILNAMNSNLVEVSLTYDDSSNSSSPCKITVPNEGRNCQLDFTIPRDMEPPILIHYGLTNFYQNYNTYMKGRDDRQLMGQKSYPASGDPCEPLRQLGGIYLNPCGYIANTLFNDVITLTSGNSADDTPLVMIEDGIAWKSDLKYKFKQPEEFHSEQCETCDSCFCNDTKWSCKEPYLDKDGNCHRYFYPEDNTTQYLYEV